MLLKGPMKKHVFFLLPDLRELNFFLGVQWKDKMGLVWMV